MGSSNVGGQVGEGVGKGIGLLFNFFREKQKEAKADDLVDRLEEQFRQDLAVPPTASVEATPAPTPGTPPPGSPSRMRSAEGTPLKDALAQIRFEEGEESIDDPLGLGDSGTKTFTDFEGSTKTEGELSADPFMDEMSAERRLDAVKEDMSKTLGANLTMRKALREVDDIYDPGTPEHTSLVEALTRSSDAAAHQIRAGMLGKRLRELGATVTDEQVLAMGPQAADVLNDDIVNLPSLPNVNVVTEEGIIPPGQPGAGSPGTRKILVDDTGKFIAYAGNPHFTPDPIQRHQDVDASHIATQTRLADKQLRGAADFVNSAHEAMKLLDSETIMGSSVTWVRGVESFLRSSSALIRGEMQLKNKDGSTWDPEALPDDFYGGISILHDKTRMMLGRDANLRSLYAHLAIMYFRSTNPQAKSMSDKNLKLSMTALGGNLNDPKQMRDVLRLITSRVVERAANASAGFDLGDYDAYVNTISGPRNKVDILSGELPYQSGYYVDPRIALEMRFGTDIDAPGQTVEEALQAPDGSRLVSAWYDVSTNARMTMEQIQKRLDDSELSGVTLDMLNEAEFQPDLLRELEERLGITTAPPSISPIMVEPKADTIMSEEGMALLMQQINARNPNNPLTSIIDEERR